MRKIEVVPDRIFTIENFLSPSECAQQIQNSEALGFDAASITTKTGQQMRLDIRNNARVVFDDHALAHNLWQRVEPFVPSPLFGRSALEISEQWRFYRYHVGEVFKMHQDGSLKRDSGERTLVTLMIYLNDDYEGGETRFEVRDTPELISVQPQTGMAHLFLHTLRHEGAQVLAGSKYVLRSNIFYSAPNAK